MTLTVKVIAPDQTILDTVAEEVILPSSTGQLGILTDHAPLISALETGVLANWAVRSILMMHAKSWKLLSKLWLVLRLKISKARFKLSKMCGRLALDCRLRLLFN